MGLVTPTYHWRLPDALTIPPGLAAAAADRGLPDRLVGILAARGHRDRADLASLFDPPEQSLHDPRLLPDADVFLARVRRAGEAGERLLVFGDFDADGLTGLAILTLALRRRGLDVAPYVPDRVAEGHGLSATAVEQARAAGRTLIVTVDCGTTSRAEVAAAAGWGIDVLVTDHHHVPAELPPAMAIVNAHRPDSAYPDPRLTGAGIAFKLAQLLLADRPDGPAFALDLADLAAIGTVGDVAPILGENRSIARLGLDGLRAGSRLGLAALVERAGLVPERLDLESIGFQLAPRLNAGGRMGDAMLGLRLLLADDPGEAATLAEALEMANLARRDATAVALAEARAEADRAPDEPAVVVAGPWPAGIVGLVAGRLAEERARPAFVFATGPETWRGSARGPQGADLARALIACGDLLERHGGHPQAAGCQLLPEHYPAFRSRIIAALDSGTTPDPDRRPTLRIDLAIAADELDYRLLRELDRLSPAGPGNPAPLLAVSDLAVARVRAVGEEHTAITLRKGREVLDAICFRRPELATQLAEGDRIEVCGLLASRRFGGLETLQIEVRDVAPAGHLAALAAPSGRDLAIAAVG